ncbi:MAG: ribonuclease HII [Firmicutes bacterium]|nr:ribonuclease HII [Bacillota bacterium]
MCPPGAGRVAGVDEAGRGPLAGPVVAAAVILRPGAVIPGLDDSKKVDEDRREELYGEIIRASLAWGVGVVGTALVDRLNVLEATRLAMRRAVARLVPRPDYVLVDGWPVPDLGAPHRGVVDGDALCASVAAAFRSKPMSNGVLAWRARRIFCEPNCWRTAVTPSIVMVSSISRWVPAGRRSAPFNGSPAAPIPPPGGAFIKSAWN